MKNIIKIDCIFDDNFKFLSHIIVEVRENMQLVDQHIQQF